MSERDLVLPNGGIVTIPNAGTVSNGRKLGYNTLVAVLTPAALTSTTLSFQAAYDENATVYAPIYNEDGTPYSITVAPSRHTIVNYTKFIGVTWLKVVGGTAEGADRAITVITRKLA